MGYENRSINNGHTGLVYSLTVLQDGTLASGSEDKTIRLWKKDQSTKVLNGHTNWVYSFTVLQDGTLASRSGNKTIRLWDTKTRQSSKFFQVSLQSLYLKSLY
jgi:WD40 repeat protein